MTGVEHANMQLANFVLIAKQISQEPDKLERLGFHCSTSVTFLTI